MNPRKIVKKLVPSGLFTFIEPYGHLAEAVAFNIKSGFPGRGLKVIGVTGTNGKTTTTFMIHRMLQEAGFNTGIMTTVAWGAGEDVQSQIHHYTNVPVPELMTRLKYMQHKNVDWLVLETTSQALAQHRVFGIKYSLAVLTNVTHEHLDYHKTFERYRDAKRRMFKLANRNRHGLQVGIINAEDPSAQLFAEDVQHPLLYGVERGDLRATDVKLTPSGSSYTAKIDGQSYNIKCYLPGSFNVFNSLAAVGVGHTLGLTKEQIEKGIAALKTVEGRMNSINEGQNFDVIVDYAHTPDSFEKLFKDIKPVVKGKLIVVFGSAGRRDEAKRAVQGELAGKYADEIVLTEEDDRDIDGNLILKEIAEGAIKAGKKKDQDLFLILDRPSAISFALKRAKPSDMVMFLGKGHEKTIERANGENPWDEIAEVRSALKKLK
ncbi:MAG TPA: UDP-N-acetylmuramyl-tripeptide synthetase [Candidatus Saccharimonadales bacterium]|nr:UDP-N-acetylmuramyl-tripeptide synthetase [Candidatus Saccharimonadales bacterium]